LVDSKGKKENQLKGRTDTNKSVVFEPMAGIELGDFVVVEVASASQKTLMATPIRKSTIQEFAG
jgi:tRNA A37 methylthiotransferase MiaB